MTKEVIIDGVKYFPEKLPDLCKDPIILSSTQGKAIHLYETTDCHIKLHNAVRCIIEIEGIDNCVQVKGERNVLTDKSRLESEFIVTHKGREI